MSAVDDWRQAAADHATQWIHSGMVVGLGAGATAELAIERIGAMLADGSLTDIVAIPCSREVAIAARCLDIPLTTLEEHPAIDVTIDGADEVDPSLALIKGGGAALLHEKIVAQASRREIIVVDATKQSPQLGMRRPVPVEVIPFGWRTQASYLESLGAHVQVRTDPSGQPLHTEHGNLILDCTFGPISSPRALARTLSERAGIVEHGLFIDSATDLIVGDESGVHHIRRPHDGNM